MGVIIITRKLINILIPICLIALFFIFLANVKYVSKSVISSLFYCAKNLIPSLFPFIFLCELIFKNITFPRWFSRYLGKITNILGICQRHVKAIVLGNICGFVNGPRLICQNENKRTANANEITSSVAISSNASISFVVGIVGGVIWNSFKFGIFLYCVQIICSIVINKLCFRQRNETSFINLEQHKNTSFFSNLSNAIYSSTYTMIIICSYTIIFSIIIEILSIKFNSYEDNFILSFITSSLEFTKGVYIATAQKNMIYSAFLTGFSVGFGGVCVACQTFSSCEGFPLKKRIFVGIKAIQGIVCGLLSIIFVKLFKLECSKAVFNNVSNNEVIFNTVVVSIFIFLSLYLLKKIIKFYIFDKHY